MYYDLCIFQTNFKYMNEQMKISSRFVLSRILRENLIFEPTIFWLRLLENWLSLKVKLEKLS